MILAGLEHWSVLYDIGLFFKKLAGLDHWSVLYDIGGFRTFVCSLYWQV